MRDYYNQEEFRIYVTIDDNRIVSLTSMLKDWNLSEERPY